MKRFLRSKLILSLAALLLLISSVAVALSGSILHTYAASPSNGAWIHVSSLATTRVFHTATLLQDGRVLVAGGTSSGSYSSGFAPLIGNAELYDPTSKTWSTTGSLNTLRLNNHVSFPFMVTLQNGKALIAGGSDANNNSIDSAELYDPATGVWSYTGNLNTPRRDMSMILLNDGRALIAAGTSGPNSATSLATTELYDPTTGTWSYTANDLAVPRDGPTMVKLQDGRILLAGGNQPDYTCTNAAEIFDPTTNMWSSAGTMPFGGVGITLTVLLDGRVFGATGDCGPHTATSAVYNPVANAWTPTANVPVTPIVGSFLLNNGNVLVRSGSPDAGINPGTIPPVDEVYNPSTNTWTTTNLLLSDDNEFGSYTQLANGDVLTAGGWKCGTSNPSCTLSTAELFTVSNQSPVVNAISVSTNPVQVNTATSASANFTDADTSDTHTAIWNWGDGNTTSGTVTESNGSGSVSNTHTYTTAGVYTVTLTVTDNQGATGTGTGTITVVPTTKVTFDDINPTHPLNGAYAGINWGTGVWDVDGPIRTDTTNSASFHTATQTSGTFSFNTPSILLSTGVESNSNQTALITLSCSGNNPVSISVAPNSTATLTTNWITPCTTVTVTSSNSWNTNLDNLVYSSIQNPGVTPNPPPTPPPGPTGGYTNQGALLDTGDAGYMNGSKFTTNSSGGVATSMSVFVGNVDTGSHNQYQMAIYTDNNGTPGILVAKTNTGTLSPITWNTLPITATLQPNTTYWLMYNTNASTSTNYLNNMYFDTGAQNIAAWAKHSFSSWPTNFPTATLDTTQFSLYVSY